MPETKRSSVADSVVAAEATTDLLLETLVAGWDPEQVESVTRAPLYHQLYLLLKRAILDGTVPHGARLPTEQQLADAFDVSRITSRRAMDELAAEKLIRRKRGKGSHVIYQFRTQASQLPLRGVLEDFIQLGRNSRVRVLDVSDALPPADVRHLMELNEYDSVLTITRVGTSASGEPYAWYQSWTKAGVDLLDVKRLGETSRLLLLREAGMNLVRVEQFLGAVNADAQIATEMGVTPGDALLSLRRLSYDREGALLDIVDCLYNPRRFQYAMELNVA